MTKELLAEVLNNREIGNEITEAEGELAKKHGLLVIFGASDDLCELRGAVTDEADAYEGGTILVSLAGGGLLPDLNREDRSVLRKHGVYDVVLDLRSRAVCIKALWCAEPTISWSYETVAPHATFNIMEGREVYCRGIVIDLSNDADSLGNGGA